MLSTLGKTPIDSEMSICNDDLLSIMASFTKVCAATLCLVATMIVHAGPDFVFPPTELEGLAARPIAELVSPPEDIKATSEEPEAGDTIMQAALPS